MIKKYKIVEYTDRWTTGGIEKYIVNLVSNLDMNIFHPFILSAQKEADLYDSELAKYGIMVNFLLPHSFNNPIKRIINTWKVFYSFLLKEKPDIIHLHICQGVGFLYAYLAKRAGVKLVITHSHNSNCGNKMRIVKITGHLLCRFLFQSNADIKLACSDLAGKWLYGSDKKFDIVNIPVDLERFKFDEMKRNQMRQELQLNDEWAILNVGRMDEQKNQLFLIDLFWEFQKEYRAKLYIIGKGRYGQKIKKKVQEYALENDVVFINQTSEIEKYLCMADVFVLTSLYEGNPVVLVEAQVSGLSCVYSDSITKKAKINCNVTSVSLNEDKQTWIHKILEVSDMKMERNNGYRNVEKQGYSLEQIIQEMQDIYLNIRR